MLAVAGAVVVAAPLVLFAAYSGLFASDPAPRLAQEDEPGEPLEIAPPPDEGLTVLMKQPDPAAANAAPVAAGSPLANGWSIDLGAALSFTVLSRRFSQIAGTNQEIPFDRLEPRATIRETAGRLEARLLVGPFADAKEAQAVCDNIALPGGIECRPAAFEGEPIARE